MLQLLLSFVLLNLNLKKMIVDDVTPRPQLYFGRCYYWRG